MLSSQVQLNSPLVGVGNVTTRFREKPKDETMKSGPKVGAPCCRHLLSVALSSHQKDSKRDCATVNIDGAFLLRGPLSG